MKLKDKKMLVAIASMACWLGAASMPFGAALADDSREDRINHESPDPQGDTELDDSGGTPNDSTTSTNSAMNTSGPHVGGHWSGGISDSSLGAGTFDLLITQNGANLSGGFDMSFSSSEDFVGSLHGTSKKPGVKMTLRPNKQLKCRVKLSPTSVSNAEIKGSYSTAKCTGLSNGNFDVNFEHP